MEKTDGQLLEQFLEENRQSAFEELIKRHETLVMGVCLRVLENTHDANDAAQTAFLVLARKAKDMRQWETIAGWLYKVALNSASNLKRQINTHKRIEHMIMEEDMITHNQSDSKQVWIELRPILDAELNRLPEKYRLPLILCYLEGKSYKEAAKILNLPYATFTIRLKRGKTRLKEFLTRRGLTLSVGVLGTILTENAGAAAMSSQLVSVTAEAAVSLVDPATAGSLVGMVSPRVSLLVEEMVETMVGKKLALALLMFFLLLGIGTTSGVILHQAVQNGEEEMVKMNGSSLDSNARGNIQQTRNLTSIAHPTTEEIASHSAKAVIERLLSEIENSGSQPLDFFKILGRLQQLQQYGEEGSKAIRDFLRTRQEVVLGEDQFIGLSGSMNGRRSFLPSLRTSLIQALYEINGPISQATSLEVLRTTSSAYEAILAARNLEKVSPGVYRADALKAISEIIFKSKDPEDSRISTPQIINIDTLLMSKHPYNPDDKRTVVWKDIYTETFRLVAYYQAQEIFPQVEELIKEKPELVYHWINSLIQSPCSAEEQIDSYRRLTRNEKTLKMILENSSSFSLLDFQDEKARQWIREIYGDKMDVERKERFIQEIGKLGSKGNIYPTFWFMNENKLNSIQPFTKPRLEGALQLLNELESPLDTPALQQRLVDSRQKLNQLLQYVP